MSYIVNKSDGTVLVEVVDGTIDQSSTDITLIGKNTGSYGEFLNENFVHILENFANPTSPPNPITGQMWYDTSEGRVKVYDGSGFKVSGGTIVSNTVPITLTQGDLWIDSEKQQLHFNDGTNTVLAGPIYSAQQGVSGFLVENVFDTNNISHVIVKLYVSQILIGIYSKDQFTPKDTIPGFTGDVNIGFNVGSYSGTKFYAQTTKSDALVAQDGSLKTAESFLYSTDNSTTSGTLTIQNPTPLILGANQNNEIAISTGQFAINSNISDQNFTVQCLNGNGLKPSIFVNAQSEYVGLYTNLPTATLDVNGDTRIRGSLTVEGNTTSINTTNLAVEDLLIEIGKVDSPTDVTANGGGISLKGSNDKTLVWQSLTNAWTSSENINLASGRGYYVNGFEVLNQTTLGTTVTSAPGLNSIGALTTLQVSNLSFTVPSTISYVNPSVADGTITLLPKGAGTVNVSSKRVTDVADPIDSADAVNYQTLSAEVRTKPLGLYADTTGLSEGQIASEILSTVYPASDFDNGTICRIYCVDLGIPVPKLYTLTSGVWSFTQNL